MALQFQTPLQRDVHQRVGRMLQQAYGAAVYERDDYPGYALAWGSTSVLINVASWGDQETLVNLRSYVAAVPNARQRGDLLHYLLTRNDGLFLEKFGLSGDEILLESAIIGSALTDGWLQTGIATVGGTADEADDEIVRRWGGLREWDKAQRPNEYPIAARIFNPALRQHRQPTRNNPRPSVSGDLGDWGDKLGGLVRQATGQSGAGALEVPTEEPIARGSFEQPVTLESGEGQYDQERYDEAGDSRQQGGDQEAGESEWAETAIEETAGAEVPEGQVEYSAEASTENGVPGGEDQGSVWDHRPGDGQVWDQSLIDSPVSDQSVGDRQVWDQNVDEGQVWQHNDHQDHEQNHEQSQSEVSGGWGGEQQTESEPQSDWDADNQRWRSRE